MATIKGIMASLFIQSAGVVFQREDWGERRGECNKNASEETLCSVVKKTVIAAVSYSFNSEKEEPFETKYRNSAIVHFHHHSNTIQGHLTVMTVGTISSQKNTFAHFCLFTGQHFHIVLRNSF